MAEMFAIAAVFQFIGACISEPKKQQDAYKKAQQICADITIAKKQLIDIISLRTDIANGTIIQGDTETKILELNSEIGKRLDTIKEEQGKFKISYLISIVLNILLISIMSLFLFS